MAEPHKKMGDMLTTDLKTMGLLMNTWHLDEFRHKYKRNTIRLCDCEFATINGYM